MRLFGDRVTKVFWTVPIHGEEQKVIDVVQKHEEIYQAIREKKSCSKWDMLLDHSIPFFFPRINIDNTRFYAMPAFSQSLETILMASNLQNPNSRFKMLPKEKLVAVARQLVKTKMKLNSKVVMILKMSVWFLE